MTAICAVSGPLIDPTGALLINTPVTFVRVQNVGGTGTATVIGRDVTETSDALGLIAVDLLAGQYVARCNGTRGLFEFGVGVPDEATAALHDCIEQTPVITPGLVAQAVDARDLARDYANKAEDAEVTPGYWSAFHWMRKARLWAVQSVGVPVADGLYSAFHWAFQAALSATSAAGSATSAAGSAAAAAGSAAAAAGTARFATISDMIAAPLDVGVEPETLGYYAPGDGGGARYRIAASTAEAGSFFETLANGKVAVLLDQTVSPLQVGYNLNADAMTTPALTAANWSIMKNLLADLRASKTRQMVKFANILTPQAVFAEWISGRSCPVGFYSDSTTDGATTPGHVSSTGSDSPYRVTITESPNAYPAQMQTFANKITNLTTAARCYNGGFDGKSFRDGFGLNHWYNTWFRAAGSNVDFTDVKMIVVGFGTSDSINLNNTAGVIDAFGADLECVMVDCYLRGVQPAVQGPVMTFHNMGTTIAYRDADESVTIIEAVGKRLAEKYGCPWFSYTESVQLAMNNWEGHTWRDFHANDGVHPTDMGHRLHAGYLLTKFCDNILKLRETMPSVHAEPGHPAFIMGNHADKIFPPATGGLVLQQVQQIAKANDAYIYEWLDSEGNGKAPGVELVRMAIWVEKPAVLFQTAIQNNRAVKPITVESMTFMTSATNAGNEFDAQSQPVSEFYSVKRRLCFLHHGLNIVYVYASADGLDQKLGGFEVIDAKLNDSWHLSRGTAGGTFLTHRRSFAPSFEAYTLKTGNRWRRDPWRYYNPADNSFYYIDLTLVSSFAVGTAYQFNTHYNDLTAFQEGYNQIEIIGDVVNLKCKTAAGFATVNTQTLAGLNAKLVAGARVTLRFRSRFVSSLGLQVSVLVNGVQEYNFTPALGAMWTDGYGFDAPAVLCRNCEMVTSGTLRGLISIDKVI